ncbi:MAG: hypothetical protein KME45_28015 [Stenomitos rutilans HA7619-LM2]|jgi:hypothetical protein|nr:hypothetical protein [Stenomitos rutilans HA7619-LM2]
MKRLLTCLIGFLAFTTSSCALASLLTVTPRDFIGQTVSCPTGDRAKAEGLKVLSAQAWPQGVIILYSALCPVVRGNEKATMQPVFGHQVVKRHGATWQVSGSDSYGTVLEPSPSRQLVEYGISRSSNGDRSSQAVERYAILYGRVLQPKVLAVEAMFDNGKILRGRSSNGVFALLAAGATGVCELRVLGADNQILQQEDLIVPKQFAQTGRSVQCLPMSHQL